MAITNFIPEYWAKQVEGKLRKAHVIAQPGIVNRNYEGQISQAGDTVRIQQWGEVTVGNYVRNTDMSAPEVLSDSEKTLLIDQQKFFNFQVDDIDAAQAHDNAFPDALESAAYGLSETVDTAVAALMAAGATIRPQDIGPGEGTWAGFYKSVVKKARTAAARANLRDQELFMILPPEVVAAALDDDRVLDATKYQPVLTGEVGRTGGFRLVESNNSPTRTDGTNGLQYQVLFGSAQATSFAAQIAEIEAYRMEKRFADAVKGLYVYGHKVLHGERIGLLEIDSDTAL